MRHNVSQKNNMFHVSCFTLHECGGQAAIIALLFFVAVTLIVAVSTSSLALKGESASRSNAMGKKGYFLSEAGQEDVIYRIFTGKTVSDTVVLSLAGETATITVSDVGVDRKDITALGNFGKNTRKTLVSLLIGEGASFFYGLQVGDGGIIMENNSSILGSVFSNGSVEGQNNNVVSGEIISAGPNGLIEGVHATSSAYAHTIQDSLIEGDAYYETISESTVLGELHPASSDQVPLPLPITDEQISDWEAGAEAGGVISSPCPYQIDDTVALGPAKISCDLNITGDADVTLLGNVWVVGNIEIQDKAIIRVDASLGNKSAIVIADDPSNPSSKGIIELKNNTHFSGTGQAESYTVFVSQNNSAEIGGGIQAIKIQNNAEGDLVLIAPHGEIEIQNNVFLREVMGYKVRLKNNARVEYTAGLRNVLFSAGPSGGYEIVDWREIE